MFLNVVKLGNLVHYKSRLVMLTYVSLKLVLLMYMLMVTIWLYRI